MKIPGIHLSSDDGAAVEAAFAAIVPQPIACLNWPEEYPYAPTAAFSAFHTGDELFLRFDVEERCTMALVAEDNGPVWTDSCVEFFIAPDGEGYYNFETNCIGRMLLEYHPAHANTVRAHAETLAGIRRMPSLGGEPFAERQGGNRWSMTLVIPPRALFRHRIVRWDGLRATANLYKCGDGLSSPHFLSWRPITAPRPDFHRPEFFECIQFSEL